MRAGQVEQGGSTLTQQLVKSYFLDSRRTLRRKAEEAIMAFILESRFEKADIMNAYINEIYLGQDGRRAVHGFGLASQFYFGKPLSELNLQEIALMVAIVRGPSYYDPRRHPERALERRNLVLKVLAEQGVVKPEEAERAAKAPLGITDNAGRTANYFPAFLDLVRRQLREDYQEQALTEAGLTVFSTLDPLLQEKAEIALSDELERQDKSGRKAAKGLEGSLVVTTPQTGEVVAVVGGRRASFDGFNRALDMQRPIGSLAKPLVYLAALQSGRYTPASTILDEPIELKLENGDFWKPGNYDKKIHGAVTLVRALTQSYNLATVNLGMAVGLGPVTKTYVQLGLDEAPPKYPSILLGTAQLNPVQVAQVYNTLANGGFRSPLRAVRAVVDEAGKPLKAPELEVTEAAPARRRVHPQSHADRGVRARHGTRGQERAAAWPGRGGQDRNLERLPRQLVRWLFRRAPDRRLDGSRRQLADGTDGHDRSITGVDASDGLDQHELVRAPDAGRRRRPLDQLLLRSRDLAVLPRCRQPAFRHRPGARAKPLVPARHDTGRGGALMLVNPEGSPEDTTVPAREFAAPEPSAVPLIWSARGPDNRDRGNAHAPIDATHRRDPLPRPLAARCSLSRLSPSLRPSRPHPRRQAAAPSFRNHLRCGTRNG